MKKRLLLFSISFLALLLLVGEPNPLLSKEEENPMEKREEKLKAFREKKDRFFKEDPQSPLKDADRRKFRGLIYYPINLRCCMVGAIERYPIDPKPLYANLPTNKGKEKKYVKYGRFKFKWQGKEYVLQIYRPLGGGEIFLP